MEVLNAVQSVDDHSRRPSFAAGHAAVESGNSSMGVKNVKAMRLQKRSDIRQRPSPESLAHGQEKMRYVFLLQDIGERTLPARAHGNIKLLTWQGLGQRKDIDLSAP